MNLSQYKSLGVINRTPNSFSDHGLSLNPDHFYQQMQSFLNDDTVIIDVGFESTAPMNTAISSEDEIKRFFEFLNSMPAFSFENKIISFDTYRPESFHIMAERFSNIHHPHGVIFNDVSGVLDDDLKSVLLKYRDHKNFHYIYTFSHIPSRKHVLDHMKYLDEKKDILDQVAHAFKAAHNYFCDLGMENCLILDPGFGFSKTFEQNWRLINHFSELTEKMDESLLKHPMLIGLSKKSFLKKFLSTDSIPTLENLHLECLKKIQKSSQSPLLFRVHDPEIIKKMM